MKEHIIEAVDGIESRMVEKHVPEDVYMQTHCVIHGQETQTYMVLGVHRRGRLVSFSIEIYSHQIYPWLTWNTLRTLKAQSSVWT